MYYVYTYRGLEEEITRLICLLCIAACESEHLGGAAGGSSNTELSTGWHPRQEGGQREEESDNQSKITSWHLNENVISC